MRSSIPGSGTENAAAEAGDREPVDVDVLPEGGEVAATSNPWAVVARTFAQNRLAMFGVGVVVVVTLFSFIGRCSTPPIS